MAQSGRATSGCARCRIQPSQRLREQRLEERAGQPEHDQQRPDVPHEEVLRHVGEDQLGIEVTERGEEGDRDQEQAGGEAESPPGRDRPPLARQRHGAERVGRRDEGQRRDLKRLEDRAADVRDGEHVPIVGPPRSNRCV